MFKGCLLFILFFFFSINIFASNNAFFPHNLLVKNFEDTKLPKNISKNLIVSFVKAAQKLKDIGYVELGDYTDFMHGHVLFRFNEGAVKAELKERLEDTDHNSFIWEDLEAVAILFHTQEYDNFREGRVFKGKYGNLDRLNRNWIYFIKDNSYGKSGDIIDANLVNTLSASNKKRYRTVYAYKIDESLYNANFSQMSRSFYFFNVECSKSMDFEKTNLFKVKEENLDKCLLIQSFRCRKRNCRDGDKLRHLTKHG